MSREVGKMADYQKMYVRLFNKVTDVIEELQQAQRDTEQLYLESSGCEPLVLNPEEEKRTGHKKGFPEKRSFFSPGVSPYRPAKPVRKFLPRRTAGHWQRRHAATPAR